MQLNEQQEDAANHIDGPCFVVAVPGSGKTRVLVERTIRLINSGVNPSDIISLTFTNKAAKEMKNRIEKSTGRTDLKMFVGTFHSLCVRILRNFGSHIDMPKNFTILDSGEQKDLINRIIRNKYPEFKKEIDADAIMDAVNSHRENMDDITDDDVFTESFDKFCNGDEGMISKHDDVAKSYLSDLKKFKFVDFSGLLYETASLLQNHEVPRERVQSSHRYLQIDEAQDTNYAQFVLINLLSGMHGNVFMVGDPDQSIYGWRGARYKNIEDFIDMNKDVRVIKLTFNYRSTPEIVKVADNLIKKNKNRIDKVFKTINANGGKANYNEFYDPEQEANFVVNKIFGELSTTDAKPSDFVILYRTNFMSRVLEETCVRCGMSYKIVGGFSFYDRAEIKDCMAMLKLFVNKHDVVSFSRVAGLLDGMGNKTIRLIEDRGVEEKIGLIDSCRQILPHLSKKAHESVSRVINAYSCKHTESGKIMAHIIKELHYEDAISSSGKKTKEEKIDNVYEFVNSMDTNGNKNLGPDEFLQKISLLTSSDDVSEGDKITLMTMHAAKGLEFDVVFIIGVEHEILPHIRSVNEDGGEEEERRLFFVAITRAKKKLFVSSCKRRKIGGGGGNFNYKVCKPSPFLREAGLI